MRRTAEVAAEEQSARPPGVDLERDRRGAENMTRRAEGDADARGNLESGLRLSFLEVLEHPPCVVLSVERKRRGVLGIAFSIGAIGFLLLQVAAVGQEHATERAGSAGRKDGAAKSVAAERRQVTAVIQMGMGEHDRVERAGVDVRRFPVAQTQFLETLKEPAVDENMFGSGGYEEAAAGDGAGGAKKSQDRGR